MLTNKHPLAALLHKLLSQGLIHTILPHFLDHETINNLSDALLELLNSGEEKLTLKVEQAAVNEERVGD